MLLLLYQNTLGPPPTSFTVTFLDEVGNPLPAAIKYNIVATTAPLTGGGSGYLPHGATVPVTATASKGYQVTFTGQQAPSAGPYTFTTPGTAGAFSVTIFDSRSPNLTQAGYANQMTGLWPRDWFSDAARASGGNAYNIAYAAGWMLNFLQGQAEYVHTILRLDSCTGTDIDSFATDYFGSGLPRNTGESDTAYIARIKANLSAKRGTRAGILAVAATYGTAWIDEPWTGEVGAWNTNGVAAWSAPGTTNVPGGWGTQSPVLYVFVIPTTTQSATQAQQMKTQILAAKPAGIQVYVVSVSGNTGTLL